MEKVTIYRRGWAWRRVLWEGVMSSEAVGELLPALDKLHAAGIIDDYEISKA